jgi:pyruvate/2-oxoglutarate dehydrogenase complex dihydrolipoamide acyltransferase (E2) component
MGFESSEDGYLARIFYPAGSKDVPIGKVRFYSIKEDRGHSDLMVKIIRCL